MPYCPTTRMEFKRTGRDCLAEVITHEGAVPLTGDTQAGADGPATPKPACRFD